MKNIAMVCFSHYPADPRVRREAERLESSGINVHIICMRGAGEMKREEFGQVTAHRILSGAERKETLLRYLWLSMLFTIKACLKLLALSRDQRFDLVQVHNMPDFLILAGVVHKLLRRPLILDLHDLTPELFESKWGSGRNRVLAPLVKAVERVACRIADHIITTSMGFANRLIDRGVSPQKITLVLNAADDHLFQRRKPRQWRRIDAGAQLLYHGTVARRFGLHVAIEALHQLQEIIPHSELHIYGKYDPSYRVELERQIASLNLEKLVHLQNYVPLEKIVEVIEDSDVGIVPYLSDPFMNLALSTKTFEYVSMGLPVIASRLPSLTALFNDRSIHYFDPNNAQSLAQAVAGVCHHPTVSEEYAVRAARTYEDFSWPIMAQRYLDLITGIGARQRTQWA